MHIVVAGEEQIIVKTLQEFLSDLGHDVTCFKSVPELLNDHNKGAGWADLIILDSPEGNANEVKLMCEADNWSPEVPIIVTTAYGSIMTSEEAIAYGVHAYLRKPISLTELELILSRLAAG